MEMAQDCNQRKLGTRLSASLHPFRTGLFATETAFIQLELQSTALGPHGMRLTEPPSSACLYARGSICISRERLGGAPVSYISRPGTESVSSHLKAPYWLLRCVSLARIYAVFRICFHATY